jgi:hypothetical protein
MSLSDYLLNALLIALVFRQLRGKRLTPVQFVVPLAIVGYAALRYLHSVPTAGNDLVLAIGGAAIGLALGAGAGLLTHVTPGTDGVPIARATGWAAALWVLGVGSRMGFALFAEHGGGPALERFGVAHSITSTDAWVAGLILMALAEVVSRTAVLAVRSGVISRMRSVPVAA